MLGNVYDFKDRAYSFKFLHLSRETQKTKWEGLGILAG
jgi:hypothetical protein